MRETWWLAAEVSTWPREASARSVAGWMEAGARGQVLSTDRDAAAVRLTLQGRDLLLKWRALRPERRARTWLRPSRERSEARGLLAARRLGIEVPAPLAVGERRDGWGRLHGAVLLRPWIHGLLPADQALAAPGGEALVAPVAEALARWHQAGYRHGDAWPKNLLVSADGRAVLPIGAPRARAVRPGPRRDRARWMDLARLAAGLAVRDPSSDALRLLAPYARAMEKNEKNGSDPFFSIAALRAAVAPHLARMLAKRAQDERTRPQREPDGPPPPIPLPPDAAPPARRERPWASL